MIDYFDLESEFGWVLYIICRVKDYFGVFDFMFCEFLIFWFLDGI